MKTKLIFITSFLLVSASIYGQVPDTFFRATVNIIDFSNSPVNGADWRITFEANDLRGQPDLSTLNAGDLLFDGNCLALRLIQVSVAGSGPSATIRGEFLDVAEIGAFPRFGPGAILRPGDNGIVGQVQDASDRVNVCISWYNAQVDLGGGRVEKVNSLSDTATVFMPPRQGDVVIKSDTGFIAHRSDSTWIVTYLNTASGGGGPVDWNDLTNVPSDFSDNTDDGLTEVFHDNTILGTGISADPLRVDTTLIATQSYTENEINKRIEVEYFYSPTNATSTIVLPFLPDTRYPIQLSRKGLLNTVSRTGSVNSDWRLNGSTLTANYRGLSVGEPILIIFTKLP